MDSKWWREDLVWFQRPHSAITCHGFVRIGSMMDCLTPAKFFQMRRIPSARMLGGCAESENRAEGLQQAHFQGVLLSVSAPLLVVVSYSSSICPLVASISKSKTLVCQFLGFVLPIPSPKPLQGLVHWLPGWGTGFLLWLTEVSDREPLSWCLWHGSSKSYFPSVVCSQPKSTSQFC